MKIAQKSFDLQHARTEEIRLLRHWPLREEIRTSRDGSLPNDGRNSVRRSQRNVTRHAVTSSKIEKVVCFK